MLSRLGLHWQLAWARVLLWIASSGRDVEPTPEVHLYLADLHFRLADTYDAAGRTRLASKHRVCANKHAVQGPAPELPPAAAMAMPIPHAPIFTDARGRVPDDVA